MSGDFCVRCDNELSVYCGPCVDALRKERDEYKTRLAHAEADAEQAVHNAEYEAAQRVSAALDERNAARSERDEAHAALCQLREAATEAKEYLDDSAPVGSDEWAVRQRLDVALYPESVGGEPLPGEGKP